MKSYAMVIIVGMIGSAMLGTIGRRLEVSLSENDSNFLPAFCQLMAAILLIGLAFAAMLFVPETMLIKQRLQEVLSNSATRGSEWWKLLAIMSIAPVVYVLIIALFYLSGLRGLRRSRR